MKKLMIAFAAVAMAACAQAAAITWNSGTYSAGFKGPSEENLKNSTLYTMLTTIYADNKGSVGEILTTSSSSKASGGGSYSATVDSLDKTTTYWIKAVISSDSWTRETSLQSFTTAAVDNPSAVNFLSGNGLNGTPGNVWGDWTPVPEPTSGLLLLLGVAGLALRRRRA